MSLDEERYHVHHNLPEIGHEGQKQIQNTRITVVGAGGLGGNVLIQLGQLGIGKIVIIDDDTIELSNLQRQPLFSQKDIGKYKSEVAQQKLLELNDTVHIINHCERLTNKNRDRLLKESDIVLDCTDNLSSRLVIDAYCSAHKVPLVYGGVRGFEGCVSVFNHNNGKSFKNTFPDYEELFMAEHCNDSGVVSGVVSITASLQVSEVLKIILGLPEVLQGKLQVFHLLRNAFRTFSLK
ncbi:HesA/MoeB/ThiF family protein [Aureisphaera galaxeae]|uniref:HesA/MoeB/ThiF family protein n=1 Tax=Aureisphaera galaxeae TaxID=1538023 RepID=UPI00235098A8|nr:HesA/MoeB/ThiF family protein [Aureisphaera galaxeae]MDC8005142.1 HesA/MoeB/ThiF family protein [Aureisphaera galaxeae]